MSTTGGPNGRAEATVADELVIAFRDVSKFYGEVLGVNRVNLTIPPGITSLVGPNGSGKTTLMNLMTGLLRPTRGTIRVLGCAPDEPERLMRRLGYCTQYDSFPAGMTGRAFLGRFLRIAGYDGQTADRLAWEALDRVGLLDAADRRLAHYSKGMRQRARLAAAIAHRPEVLVLDEPLNGLDPMARAEMMALFRELAGGGLHVIISSHILHEVDALSDTVVMMKDGYVLARGEIHDVRDALGAEHPTTILVRCDAPEVLAARAFELAAPVAVRVHDDGAGLLVRTRDEDGFYQALSRIVLEDGVGIEAVEVADDNVGAVYEYLIEGAGEWA
jgi:ABC-2 type transport system ATP-binding protein